MRRWGRWLDALLIAALGAIALGQSWNRWLHPIIDAGRDLYIPERLANHGLILYRDILYFYPPVTPYLLAGVVKVLGSSLLVYTWLGIGVAAATATLLYLVADRAGNRAAGLSAACLFVSCCIAGPTSWGCNYIFPYAHAATFAMLLFLGELLALLHYATARSRWALALAMSCGIVASWTKVEFAAFAAVLFAAGVLLQRAPRRWLAAYAGAGAGSLALVAIAFRGTDWLGGNVLPAVLLESPRLRLFYRVVAGTDDLLRLAAISALGALGYAAVALLLRRKLRVAAAALMVLIAYTSLFFTAWSVLFLAAAAFAWRRRHEPVVLVAIAALLPATRVFLHLEPRWYGFVFTVPLLALITSAVFETLPRAGLYDRRAALVWLVAVGVACGVSIGRGHQHFARFTHALVTPRGTLLDDDAERARILSDAGRALAQNHVQSLVVIPEGLALNYLYEIPTPLRYQTFTPVEIDDPRAETAIVKEFEARKPRFVAIVRRDTVEFGGGEFGTGYARAVGALLRRDYEPRAAWPGSTFDMVVLERRR